MKTFGLLLASIFLIVRFGYCQHIDDNSGKTYYDNEKTKLKEVWSYKEVSTFSPTGDHSIINVTKKKHGPYFYYYENGKIKISGNYKNDKKDGVWKYFDEHGKMIRTENYKDGELLDT